METEQELQARLGVNEGYLPEADQPAGKELPPESGAIASESAGEGQNHDYRPPSKSKSALIGI
ncbi:MAG TPA: hypothetical protein VFX86_03730, partial [Candidatus Saccharimonadales bacterium]|nr:hypothetical protein [Candidatus Saccharimonadales bacterium]